MCHLSRPFAICLLPAYTPRPFLHSSADTSEDRSFELEVIKRLGIHFSEYVMSLETQARDVWVFRNHRLRESHPGYSGESVLEALYQGVNFHYIFAPKTEAAKS